MVLGAPDLQTWFPQANYSWSPKFEVAKVLSLAHFSPIGDLICICTSIQASVLDGAHHVSSHIDICNSPIFRRPEDITRVDHELGVATSL